MPLVIESIKRKGFKSYGGFLGYNGYSSYVECGLIKKGVTGACVVKLQNILIQKGYSLPKYGADGTFGTETETAVKAFQRDNGLSVDGQVGVNTWNALMAVTPVPVPTPTPTPMPKPAIDLKKYLPYVLIGGGFLIIVIYLLKRK